MTGWAAVFFFGKTPLVGPWTGRLNVKKNSRITKGKVIEPAVIGVILDLGNCLNLTDSRHQDVIREAYRGICDLCAAQSEQLPKNTEKSRKLDCAVINAAVELNTGKGYPDFDSIRSPYFEGEPIYPNAYFMEKTHIQICVRNPECIKGYFLPSDFLKK